MIIHLSDFATAFVFHKSSQILACLLLNSFSNCGRFPHCRLNPSTTNMKSSFWIPALQGAGKWLCYASLIISIGLFSAPALGNTRFGLDDVAEVAKRLAAEPFKPPPSVPDFLKQLTYDQYRDIRFDSAQSLWKDAGGNFQVQFIHPGLYYDHPVTINVRESTGSRRVTFSPKLFTYGNNKIAEQIPAELGFAGFRITYPFYKKDEYNHAIVFAGASYFRAVAKNQVFGLSARGLAIDTGLPSGEEFPYFKEFWLEKPAPGARVMRLYALLDSESLTGAYRFDIQPGEETVADVWATLFERKRAKQLGIAPITSMFFYAEEKPRPQGYWRPEVHDSDGLLIAASNGEWIWRPLLNPEKLQINSFELDGLRGFGLLQRDRTFSHYEDLEARYDLRPNAWGIPTHNWGKGEVKLVQIPSKSEFNDNIVAFWTPKNLPEPGKPIEFSYKIYFHAQEPNAVNRGRTVATRVGDGDEKGSKRVVIDFTGRNLAALPEN